MTVGASASAHTALYLATMRSEKAQEAAILQVVSDATERAAQVAKAAPGQGLGQNVDVSV